MRRKDVAPITSSGCGDANRFLAGPPANQLGTNLNQLGTGPSTSKRGVCLIRFRPNREPLMGCSDSKMLLVCLANLHQTAFLNVIILKVLNQSASFFTDEEARSARTRSNSSKKTRKKIRRKKMLQVVNKDCC